MQRINNNVSIDSQKFAASDSMKNYDEAIKLPNGNIPTFACGPLTKQRYINPKIEEELVEFKHEIEEKYHASSINYTYKFPRPLVEITHTNSYSMLN